VEDPLLLVILVPWRIRAPLSWSTFRDGLVVEVPKVLSEMITSSKSPLAYSAAVLFGARELRWAHAVDSRLVPLKVCKTGEICGGSAVGEVATP
jgi:hypothetical protein